MAGRTGSRLDPCVCISSRGKEAGYAPMARSAIGAGNWNGSRVRAVLRGRVHHRRPQECLPVMAAIATY